MASELAVKRTATTRRVPPHVLLGELLGTPNTTRHFLKYDDIHRKFIILCVDCLNLLKHFVVGSQTRDPRLLTLEDPGFCHSH